MFEIRPAAAEDFAAIEQLLSLCLLPHDTVRQPDTRFLVAETGRGIIGCSAVSALDDTAALLRSIAVMPGYRKQNVARHLFQHTLTQAEQAGLRDFYVLTHSASEYFLPLGFRRLAWRDAPENVRQSPYARSAAGQTPTLLHRPVAQLAAATEALNPVIQAAKQHFDRGYHCAESVLLAVSEHLGIRSPLIPAIATGYCHGISHSWGTCGALNGGIMAVNLALGRTTASESVAPNYHAVRQLIDGFRQACGGTECSRLMACDLNSATGKQIYRDNQVSQQCREYVGVAAGLALGAIAPAAGRAAA